MAASLLPTFAEFIRRASDAELAQETVVPMHLRLAGAKQGSRTLSVAYAPFDHINLSATVVIVGLTPGRHQMREALLEARRLLRAGASIETAAASAKIHASFSGPMRANLVAMLDHVGLANKLGLRSTAELWGRASDRAHFTSALRYPVFVDGANYSGAPDMLRTPLLRDQLTRWLPQDLAALPDAVVVPLGPKVTAGVEAAAAAAGFDRRRVLSGLPHPSGANAERIAFFLDRKPRDGLSAKVAPDVILAGRDAVVASVARLGGLA